jgi:MtN3 and saliva related transmembrane protein
MGGIEIEIFGILAAFLVNGATLPQILKTITTKQVRDISLPYWIIVFVGAFLWTVYGTLTHGLALIFSSAVSCGLCLIMMALILRYR